jgi:hypothetical protein
MKKDSIKEKKFSILGEEIKKEINEIVDQRIKSLTATDMQEIVQCLLKESDILISNKIKEHLTFLSEKLIETLNPKQE